MVLVDTQDDDIVAAPVTTHHPRDLFDVELVYWEAAGLIRRSIVRPHKLSAIDKRLVGRLPEADWKRVQDSLKRLGIGG